jgi:hypothetical protein
MPPGEADFCAEFIADRRTSVLLLVLQDLFAKSMLLLVLQDLFAKLSDPGYNISFENHVYGLPPSHYQKWPLLGEQFDILTTTKVR